MENDQLLLLSNAIKTSRKNIVIKNGWAIFRNNCKEFDGVSVRNLMAFINTLKEKYPRINMPIFLDLGDIVFKDKLTYIFLEILCYILINEYKHKVILRASVKHTIFTEGIHSSPLLLLNSNDDKNLVKFLNRCSDDIYKSHYRKILGKGEDNAELSRRMDEISYFLKNLDINTEYVDELSEVITELIGNSWEHASAECLVDVDVTSSYHKEGQTSDESYVGVNLAILNFSDKLLGTTLKHRIKDNNGVLPERYKCVKKAYEQHESFFDEMYREEDFFNIASFQHKISGREDKMLTGGTGLTKLISSLEKRSDEHNCYLISGERALWFWHKYLEYNEDGWIGFNEENDFVILSTDWICSK